MERELLQVAQLASNGMLRAGMERKPTTLVKRKVTAADFRQMAFGDLQHSIQQARRNRKKFSILVFKVGMLGGMRIVEMEKRKRDPH